MSYNFSPQIAIDTLTRVGLKMLGAVALLIIGRMLIKLALALTAKALNRQHLDATILRYINSALSVTLNIILVVALLRFLRGGNHHVCRAAGRGWDRNWCNMEWTAREFCSRYFSCAAAAV